MNRTLSKWVGDADALHHFKYFKIEQGQSRFEYVRNRVDDYFLSLVGELFTQLREKSDGFDEWLRLGNAFSYFFSNKDELITSANISKLDAALYAATAFYCGGYPASAYLSLRNQNFSKTNETYRACYDLMVKPRTINSKLVKDLLSFFRQGDLSGLESILEYVRKSSIENLHNGPEEWIPSYLLEQLVERFLGINMRSVLPNGFSDFWNPLINSFLNRFPPTWEFFPSQIQAIKQGLFEKNETFSLQMPTGAGKTTLCEALLYWQAKNNDSQVAVLLVPFRSLAYELKTTVVKRLNSMNIPSRCSYGGTVPSVDEVKDLDFLKVLVSTPESLSALLIANPEFLKRISLLICDEGHLLDGGTRGVSLELLLSRLKSQSDITPKMVFMSAIVPNIEEINAWLGGSDNSVVRSNYKPALAEFAALSPINNGEELRIDLVMHPHERVPTKYSVGGFLSKTDFVGVNPKTNRRKTHDYSSVKAQAIACARKALVMGPAAVFSATKKGKQGVTGLADELLKQLNFNIPLPKPIDYINKTKVDEVVRYFEIEYGEDWIGTRALREGVAIHHGDIPQETREVIESLVREKQVCLVICTSTLSEGVNLPIRTLVLYSVQRGRKGERPKDILMRDVKNLVGRAGRAGASTKGLVICANKKQWSLVRQVALQEIGEPVTGALRSLLQALLHTLSENFVTLTNEYLESDSSLFTLIDGIDSTLIDLAAEEIGEDDLIQMTIRISNETFAARQVDEYSKVLLNDIFELRAKKVYGLKQTGRLEWVR